MEINFWQVILAGTAASVVWFVVGGVLYMNPAVAKIYKWAEKFPALKKWPDIKKNIVFQFLGILIQSLLWAFVFAFLQPIFSNNILSAGLSFALILFIIKIIPRAYDMWIQTTYPNKLLLIEFINGTIGCIIIGLIFAWMI